jgi:hypothetical protein
VSASRRPRRRRGFRSRFAWYDDAERFLISWQRKSVWRYGRAVQGHTPRTKSRMSRALGRLRVIEAMRGPTTGIVAAATTLALAAGCAGTAAATAMSTQRAPGAGTVAGTVVFGRHDSGVAVSVFRCVRQSRPRRTVVNGCPAGTRPQQVTGEKVRPDDSHFSFRLKPGRYRIYDQLTRDSTPFGCIDATHKVSVRANRTTHVTLHTDFLNAGCGISE